MGKHASTAGEPRQVMELGQPVRRNDGKPIDLAI
jgi:hypothetical protein